MLSKLRTSTIILLLFISSRFSAYDWITLSNRAHRTLQDLNTTEETDFDLDLNVHLSGSTDVLEHIDKSLFLKSALEQSIKDFINIDFECNEGLDVPSFFSMDLEIPQDSQNERIRGLQESSTCSLDGSNLEGLQNVKCVSVKSKCRGTKEKCRERVNDRFSDNLKTHKEKNRIPTDPCAFSIWDLFDQKVMTLGTFRYDVNHIQPENIRKNIDMSFKVGFKPNELGLRDKIDDIISVDPGDPVKQEVLCLEDCDTQRKALESIYSDFGLTLDQGKHVCEHQGINCDKHHFITQIWLCKYLFGNK